MYRIITLGRVLLMRGIYGMFFFLRLMGWREFYLILEPMGLWTGFTPFPDLEIQRIE